MTTLLSLLTTALPLIGKYAIPALAGLLAERVEDATKESGQGELKKGVVTNLLDEGDDDPEYRSLLSDTVEIGVRWMKYRRKQQVG